MNVYLEKIIGRIYVPVSCLDFGGLSYFFTFSAVYFPKNGLSLTPINSRLKFFHSLRFFLTIRLDAFLNHMFILEQAVIVR